LEPTDYISSISFTTTEVYDTPVTLDPTKAPGIDLISPKILQTYVLQFCAIIYLPHLSDTLAFLQAGKSTRSYQFSKLVTKLQLKTTDPSSTSKVFER